MVVNEVCVVEVVNKYVGIPMWLVFGGGKGNEYNVEFCM